VLNDLTDPTFVALADVDGNAWGLAADGVWALPAGGAPTRYPDDDVNVTDMTVGPDGRLYYTDSSANVYQVAISDSSAKTPTDFPLGAGTEAEAIANAGDELWFSTSANELESITTVGYLSSPYSDGVSSEPHTLTTGANGELYAVNAAGNAILEVDSSTGSVLHTYSVSGSPGISAILAGPDGNVWFTETSANQIGELDVSTGTFTSRQLPAGYRLPASGSATIALGPSDSNTLFFGAQTSAGALAIGEVSNIPAEMQTTTNSTTSTIPKSPPPGRVKVWSKATVSSKGVVGVSVSCKSATCSGKVTLTVTEKVKHKKKKVTLGSASYRLKAGNSGTVSVKLSSAGKSLLKKHNGKLKATVTVTVKGGKKTTATVTLTRAKSRRPGRALSPARGARNAYGLTR
jgi:hypothetical protein